MDADIQIMLEQRLGRLHARQRLGIERELEGKIFGRGTCDMKAGLGAAVFAAEAIRRAPVFVITAGTSSR